MQVLGSQTFTRKYLYCSFLEGPFGIQKCVRMSKGRFCNIGSLTSRVLVRAWRFEGSCFGCGRSASRHDGPF